MSKFKKTLENAISNNDYEKVKSLIKDGIDIEYGRLPLSLAIKSGNTEVVKLLIKSGVVIKEDDHAMLALTAEKNNFSMVKLLIESGISVKGYGGAILGSAAMMNDNIEFIKYLVDNGANLNGFDNDNFALKMAAEHGNLNIVKYLILECGQDPEIVLKRRTSEKNVLFWVENYKQSNAFKKNLENKLPEKEHFVIKRKI